MTYEEVNFRLNALIDDGNRQMKKLNNRMSLSELEDYLEVMDKRHSEMLYLAKQISPKQCECENDQQPTRRTRVGKLDYSHYEGNDV